MDGTLSSWNLYRGCLTSLTLPLLVCPLGFAAQQVNLKSVACGWQYDATEKVRTADGEHLESSSKLTLAYKRLCLGAVHELLVSVS